MNAARTQDVTFVSSTLSDFGGLVTGDVIYQPSSTGGIDKYMLVQNATLNGANNRLYKRTATVGTSVLVGVTTATTDVALVANNTGKILAIGEYFFGKMSNYTVESDGSATIAPGATLMPSDVGGGNDGRAEGFAAAAGRTCIGVNNTDAAAAVTVLRVLGELPSLKAST